MASTFRLAHQIAMLYQGQIVACGPPSAFRSSQHTVVQQFLRASTVGAVVERGGA
jgi:ABC-type transporter Mla maintaining outer membrane lipid asymmetry ATPase subunit MlaF